MTHNVYHQGAWSLALLRLRKLAEMNQSTLIEADRDAKIVYQKYQDLFHPRYLDKLEPQEFGTFLTFKGNRHWKGIARHKSFLLKEWDIVLSGLKFLLDEQRPITDRLDAILTPSGSSTGKIPHMGQAVVTPILHVVYPSKYAPFNNVAEAFCLDWDLIRPEPGESFGSKYSKALNALKKLSDELDLSYWQLDTLWGLLKDMDDEEYESWYAETLQEILVDLEISAGHKQIAVDTFERLIIGDSLELDNEEAANKLSDKSYTEGRTEILRSTKGMRRSAQLIKDAKSKYGYSCYVCGFDFSSAYGSHGEQYIEIHHESPLAEHNSLIETSLDDVKPVCSNCHRMLHRYRDKPLSVNDLKDMVRLQRKKRP